MSKNENKVSKISKSYKIMPFYNVLFDSCLQLYKRNGMFESLIAQRLGLDEFPKIPKFDKNTLLTYLIENLKEEKYSEQEVKELFLQDRLLELIRLGEDLHRNDKREVFNLRVMPRIKDDIERLSFSTKTLGEVIEAAIAHFITNCDETQYKIIKFIFEGELLYYSKRN